jgi:ABC-type Co2+ transport system permease subunit
VDVYQQLFVGGLVSYNVSGVQHMLCCVYAVFSSSCVLYPMLSVYLNCPFVIAPSVFSNVYLLFTSLLKLRNIFLNLSPPINETTMNIAKPDSVLQSM